MGANPVAGREDHRQIIAAGHLAQQQNSPEQGQSAQARDRERHARAMTGILPIPPEANQEKRGQTGHLPENQQQEQILRQNDAEHGAHEEQEIGVKQAQVVARGQVITGVEDDQQTDPEDHQGEQETESVQAKGQIQSCFRKP